MKSANPKRTVDNTLRHIKIRADEEPRAVPVDKELEDIKVDKRRK